MKQASLKLKSYARGLDVIDSGNLRKKILDGMLSVLVGLALVYFVLLANMIFDIVERKSLEARAGLLASEVGALELEYLSKSEKVDLELARSLGFTEIKATFAKRNSTLGRLDLAKNEI